MKASMRGKVKHTQGPFHLTPGNPHYAIYDPRCVYVAIARGERECITSEEAQANCRLFAAAPDLLAACKALQMEAAARGCGLRIADEAIQKAEGL